MEVEKKKSPSGNWRRDVEKNGEAKRVIIEMSIYSVKQTSQWKSLKRRENDLLTN